jgi:DNA-binding LytR/AlgR family response regulator
MLKPVFVTHEGALMPVDILDIVCLRVDNNYTRMYLSNKTHCIVCLSLTGVLKRLPDDIFIRTSRTYAVSVYFIERIEKTTVIVAGEPIPIARDKYGSVLEKLVVLR